MNIFQCIVDLLRSAATDVDEAETSMSLVKRRALDSDVIFLALIIRIWHLANPLPLALQHRERRLVHQHRMLSAQEVGQRIEQRLTRVERPVMQIVAPRVVTKTRLRREQQALGLVQRNSETVQLCGLDHQD